VSLNFPLAIIDDDRDMLRVLEKFLERNTIGADIFSDPRKALSAMNKNRYGVIISDVNMPGMSGLELLDAVREISPSTVVIMITGFGSVRSAVDAMKKGAFDYSNKPFDYEEFLTVVQKAIGQYQLKREVEDLRQTVHERYSFMNIIGKSRAMQDIFGTIGRIASIRTNVLLEGDSGTGKELIARAIHHAGVRKNGPFVAINCGALPETLLESELFGHERGAYTGAVSREQGLFVSADKGTIFLDEIADMPLTMQAKLLRVLEDWEIRPVGGSTVRRIDTRVICASKSNLNICVTEGRFREDLFYRLNVVTIGLPKLVDRHEDIPLLINHFLSMYAKEHGHEAYTLSRDTLEALLNYSWPGNVRELQHVLERAGILARESEITIDDLPSALRDAASAGKDQNVSQSLKRLEDIEKKHILNVLREVDWKRSQAAEILGINRRTLYRKIKEYEIGE